MNVTFKLAGGNVAGNTADIIKTGKYGTALTAPAPVQTGFVFKGWNPALPSPLLFPAANAEYTAQWAPVYAITFGVDGVGGGVGGTLKATVGETEINSGDKVEHGKTVTFTAAPAAGYRIKEWKLGEEVIAEAGTNTEYTLTVTKPAAVTVSFEPKKALLTLEAGKNTVKVKAKTADGSAIKVEGCNVNELANEAETTLTVTDPDRKVELIGDITELNCSGEKTPGGNRPLAELDVSGLTALQKLDCQYNHITALNVQGLTALQELYCNTNQIPELNVQGLTKLQKLNCSGNQLKTLNVQGLTELQELICNNNDQLATLNVQGCTSLQKLICNNNQLTALDVQGLTSLQELNCRSNKLTSLNVQGLTELQELYCSGNQLKTLNVQGLTKLQKLNCSGNQLKTLNVQGLTKLQELYCYYNQLTELNVQDLTALQKLDCKENQLSSLNVQGCTSLKMLRCYYNKLNADAFTKLFNDLPAREVSDRAETTLYVEVIDPADPPEGNYTDFTQPESLKKAFVGAKNIKHWKMQKMNGYLEEDI